MKRKWCAKFVSVLICGALLLGLAGCGAKEQPAESATNDESSAQEDTKIQEDAQAQEEAAVVEAKNDTGDVVTLTIGVWADDEAGRLENKKPR